MRAFAITASERIAANAAPDAMSQSKLISTVFCSALLLSSLAVAQKKPLTLDENFEFVNLSGVKISPDGAAVVVGTRRPDWKQERFRRDLWLVREGSEPVLLTQSGQDGNAEWSLDGRWIAFLSSRPMPFYKPADGEKEKTISQLYVIPASGGEAVPVTRGEESVHSFAWTPDSKSLYFVTREPWSKAKRDAYKKEWHDVQRYREGDRGDVIARISLADALANAARVPSAAEAPPSKDDKSKQEEETAEAPGVKLLAHTNYFASDLEVSPDGRRIAFTSAPPHHRVEAPEDFEIYLLDANGGEPKRLTNNQAREGDLHWSPDSKLLFFGTRGEVDHYNNVQGRIYSLDPENGKIQRWAGSFSGAVGEYDFAPDGTLVSTGQVGTEVQLYTTSGATGELRIVNGLAGSYNDVSMAKHSPKVAFIYSAFDKPTEVYVADSLAKLGQARPITAFNKLFTERALPQGTSYKWKTDDGSTVAGVLLYPPGKFGAKNLPVLTFIHGGPASADGNRFRAGSNFATMAATQGWLVFSPNYRGSTGYGDKFESEITPHLVSRPGRDILDGIDALVHEGIADPNRLTVAGYSYGGYMTNWLITQTTRFKAAATGAGAVEHTANWGNDDLTFDDASYFGGKTPWEDEKIYNDEAAIFQINKVKTPTHVVGGSEDIRVYIGEQYLLERALHTLKVPSTLLIFPGEGHGLDKNPWHSRIKVREELKWLQKYCPTQGGGAVSAVSAGQE